MLGVAFSRTTLLASVPIAALAGACTTPPEATGPAASPSPLIAPAAPVPPAERPEPVAAAGVDWVRLDSGEWLKGEILGFDGKSLEFDSEVLETLHLDWDDVSEVRSARPFTLLLSDQNAVVGVVQVVGDRVLVEDEEDGGEVFELPRDALQRMVPGRPREANYWSGKIRLGASVRSGNTEQTDTNLFASAKRETASTRLDLSIDSVYGTLDGVENVNNHTFRGREDLYVSPRFYVTPLGIEVFRDRFQNIEQRTTPYSGAGYKVADEAKLEWDVLGGLGYRFTRFDSVPPGEDESVGTAVVQLGTAASSDLTEWIELELRYSAQIGLEDVQDTNQDASVTLSVDLPWDFDLDVRVVWKRIGDPIENEDGMTPRRDDLRVEIGLGWEF